MKNRGKFLKGHHYSPATEFKKGHLGLKGVQSPGWKGGKTIDARGYVLIKNREHPHTKANGYVQEHRLIMEKYLGRFLYNEEVVHHVNGIKDDNRLENLRLFSRHGEHIKEEGKMGVYIGSHRNQKRDVNGRFVLCQSL